ALRRMALSMAKKLNHPPISFLKRHFEEEDTAIRFLALARSMFNLDDDALPEEAHRGRKKE
ncbi:MAG: glutamyl-tRNA reductase, partial [Deltaproteobacteria bacterium]|nr:glutamyl-tRNA reductase [Deltaproteobacteria bacterium]